MKTIPLTKGYYAKVDDEDYEELTKRRWQAATTKYKGKINDVRPVRSVYKPRRTLQMGREILKPPKGRYIDHINGDALDNRKCNLRLCSGTENQRNKIRSSNNKSGYKGVFARGKKFIAQIKVEKYEYLGTFPDRVSAAHAYNKAAKKHYGKFARLNIIKK